MLYKLRLEEIDKNLAKKKLNQVVKIRIDENMLLFLEDGKELALYMKIDDYAKPLKMFSTK